VEKKNHTYMAYVVIALVLLAHGSIVQTDDGGDVVRSGLVGAGGGALIGGAFGGRRGAGIGAGVGAGLGILGAASRNRDRRNDDYDDNDYYEDDDNGEEKVITRSENNNDIDGEGYRERSVKSRRSYEQKTYGDKKSTEEEVICPAPFSRDYYLGRPCQNVSEPSLDSKHREAYEREKMIKAED